MKGTRVVFDMSTKLCCKDRLGVLLTKCLEGKENWFLFRCEGLRKYLLVYGYPYICTMAPLEVSSKPRFFSSDPFLCVDILKGHAVSLPCQDARGPVVLLGEA